MAVPREEIRRRLAVKATIKRASAKARANMNRLDADVLGQLDGIYRRAAADLQAAIASHADGQNTLRLQTQRELLSQVNVRLSQLQEARDELLDEGLRAAARMGVSAYSGALPADSLAQTADDALKYVRSFVAEDGLQLSDRVWRIDRRARDVVSRAIENAVVQGHSASQAANEFLARGEPVPSDIAAKLGAANADKVGRTVARDLLQAEGAPRWQVMRVFRTELNRAHGEAYMAGGEDTEDFAGWRFLLSPNHPEPDICDMHARVNRYGLGPGVYPDRARCPWPAHPNTLSYVEIVFDDEIQAEDRDGKQDRVEWIQEQPPHIQEGVLGSRKKRAALQQGLLKENQIATPWQVLKERYARQGVDVDALRVTPQQIQPSAAAGSVADVQREAWQYVLDQGEATGWEHAVVYDMNTGREFIRKTVRSKNSVSFTPAEVQVMLDPKNRLELVHNHPSSSSLSLPDLRMGTLPGVHTVVAVGHDGTVYLGRSLSTPEVIEDAHRIADRGIYDFIRPKIHSGELSLDLMNVTQWHLVNSVLARLSMIDYEARNVTGGLKRALASLDSREVDQVIERIKNRIAQEYLDL